MVQLKVDGLDGFRRKEKEFKRRHFELFIDKTSRLTIDAGVDEVVRAVPTTIGEHSVYVEYDEDLPRFFLYASQASQDIPGFVAKGRTETQLINFKEAIYSIELLPVVSKVGFWKDWWNRVDRIASYRLEIKTQSFK